MICSVCEKDISNIFYMISKGIVKIEKDENEDEFTNSTVIGSSLLCNDCIPEEIKNKMHETNFDDCINCDIEFKDEDICYTIYKMKNNNIKTAISFCEKCFKNILGDNYNQQK